MFGHIIQNTAERAYTKWFVIGYRKSVFSVLLRPDNDMATRLVAYYIAKSPQSLN